VVLFPTENSEQAPISNSICPPDNIVHIANPGLQCVEAD
jgi:hypothetical protein